SGSQRGLCMRVEIASDVPPLVTVDGGALRRILLNLGANAVRATSRGAVCFRVCYEDGMLACAVIDTGAGMTQVQQERLFRAWATCGAEGGAGLGLVLAAELAWRMRATLTVVSTRGVGSTFELRVPL
nr:ATP-binding protein [Candidatus Eremiobacteraeota bacterium]